MSEPYILAIKLSIKVNNKTVCGVENCFIWFILTCKSFGPLNFWIYVFDTITFKVIIAILVLLYHKLHHEIKITYLNCTQEEMPWCEQRFKSNNVSLKYINK